MLDEQLRAQAAATGMLVEAAESAGHGAAYIEDALRQIAVRSAIRRIEVTAEDGPSHSTGQSALRVDELEPAFARLANHTGEGLASSCGRRGTPCSTVRPD